MSGLYSYITGCIVFIVLGALHMFVHLTDLSRPDVIDPLTAVGIVESGGQSAALVDLWNGISLLMGWFMAMIGFLGLASLDNGRPKRTVCLVYILIFAGVFLSGALYFGPAQMIGAVIGWVLFGWAYNKS